ncbi:unnamed protein product, partial [Amoebophrya sp. A120]
GQGSHFEREVCFYADDGVLLVAAKTRAGLVKAMNTMADRLRTELASLGLTLDPEKTKCLVFDASLVGKQVAGREQRRHEFLREGRGKTGPQVLDLPWEAAPLPGLPFPQVSHHRVLGVEVDHLFHFGRHVSNTIEKIRRRLPILKRLSNYEWGLEPYVFAQTARALITQTATWGVASWGSYCPTAVMRRMNTDGLNPAQRLVVANTKLMRLESLRILSQSTSIQNAYVR